MAENLQCIIPGNPDVAGVGIRISVYLQAFIGMLGPALRLWRAGFKADDYGNKLGMKEEPAVVAIRGSHVLLLTGIALVVSGIIQAATSDITPYHAMILVNLSGITVMAAVFPFLFFMFFDIDALAKRLRKITRGRDIKALKPSQGTLLPPKILWGLRKLLLLHGLHLTSISAFGFWLIITLPSSDSSFCPTSTVLSIFGLRIGLINHAFRHFCLVSFGMILAPIINLFLIELMFLLPIAFFLMVTGFSIVIILYCVFLLYKALQITYSFFSSQFHSAFGRHLNVVRQRLNAVLQRLGAVLQRLGAVLQRLGAIWQRLGVVSWHLDVANRFRFDRFTGFAFFVALVVPSLAIAFMIILIEGTIHANHVELGESQWSLGQTLAIFAVLIPALDLWGLFEGRFDLEGRVVIMICSKAFASAGSEVATELASCGVFVVLYGFNELEQPLYEARKVPSRHGSGQIFRITKDSLSLRSSTAEGPGSMSPLERLFTYTTCLLGEVDDLIVLATDVTGDISIVGELPSLLQRQKTKRLTVLTSFTSYRLYSTLNIHALTARLHLLFPTHSEDETNTGVIDPQAPHVELSSQPAANNTLTTIEQPALLSPAYCVHAGSSGEESPVEVHPIEGITVLKFDQPHETAQSEIAQRVCFLMGSGSWWSKRRYEREKESMLQGG